eukprot:jgi/Mesvir1/2705/Mv05102-RA.1
MGDEGWLSKTWSSLWNIDKDGLKKSLPVYKEMSAIRDFKDVPRWTSADVDEFVKSDPVYGPRVEALETGGLICLAGGLLSGLGLAAVSLRYSRSLHGSALALVAGTAGGYLVSDEVAKYALGLYKFDRLETHVKFLEWWKAKSSK